MRLTHLAIWDDDIFGNESIKLATSTLGSIDTLVSLSYGASTTKPSFLQLLPFISSGKLCHLKHLEWPIVDDISPVPSTEVLKHMLPSLAFFSCMTNPSGVLRPDNVPAMLQVLGIEEICVVAVVIASNNITDPAQVYALYPELTHPKFVVVPSPKSWDIDWHSHVNGEPNYWMKAEMIVLERQSYKS